MFKLHEVLGVNSFGEIKAKPQERVIPEKEYHELAERLGQLPTKEQQRDYFYRAKARGAKWERE